MVLKLISLEAPALLSIVAFLLTGKLLSLAAYFYVFFLVIAQRPNFEKISKTLDLEPSEKEAIKQSLN